MKQAIFFDLDGTLWNAVGAIHDSWNQTMERLHQPYRFSLKTITSTMGLTPEETLPITFPDSNKEEGMKLFKECLHDEISYLAKKPGALYPDEESVLRELKGFYALYVVSNSDKGYVENYLHAYHFESLFAGHICAGDTGLSKAENIVYLKKREGIDEVIYLGDTAKDRDEAKKAGVKFIHAAYGFGTFSPDPVKIRTLSELPLKAKELWNRRGSIKDEYRF